MDLKNTLREDNLVVLKQGVKTFKVGMNQTEFKPNEYYRAIQLQNGNHKEVVINGELFINEQYDEVFETVQDLFLREFEQLGIIVNGKLISKTAFNKICHVNLYGRTVQRGFQIAYICKHPKDLMYVIMPYFSHDNKANTLKHAYQIISNIIEGDLQCVEDNILQRTNTGLPLQMGSSHIFKFEDKSDYKSFSLD